MAGNKPLASSDKKLRGNPSKRKLNDKEAEPRRYEKPPDPPFWLGKYAVDSWNTNAPILMELGLLTEADFEMFAALCQNIHIMIEASLDIEENGMTIIGARGRARNPALAAFAAATTAIRSLTSEFGMSPSSRSKIKIPDPADLGLEGLDVEEEDDAN